MNRDALLIIGVLSVFAFGGVYMSTKRGIRNNNPFNIKKSDRNNWRGKVPSSDPVFEQFDSMINGVRAGYVLLNNYRKKYGDDTVYKIINRFAPDTENPTNAYAEFVAKKLGKGVHDKIADTDLFSLGSHIVRFENGEYLPPEVMALGFKAALS